MKLRKLEIQNFKGVGHAIFNLSDHLNLFVGLNGSGKSTILDAIVISLSWLVNRIQKDNSNGKVIGESNIKNGTTSSSISLVVENDHTAYEWILNSSLRGYDSREKSELTGATYLASNLREEYRRFRPLPVIVYYPINRVVNSNALFSSRREAYNTIDVYDNALGGKTNYQSFFDWFKQQEDIVNEEASSRSRWTELNINWIRRRATKLYSSLIKELGVEDITDEVALERRKDYYLSRELSHSDPRQIFHELLEAIHFNVNASNEYRDANGLMYRDFEFILHKISSLSEAKKERSVEPDDYAFRTMFQIVVEISSLMEHSLNRELHVKGWIHVLWDAFNLGLHISMWWLNDTSKKEIDRLFVEYNPTRKLQLRNKDHYVEIFIDSIASVIKGDAERYDNATRNQGRELYFVSKTVADFIPGFSNLRIKRSPRPHMLVDKEGEALSVDSLSDGEKNLIALVGDIARRLSMANANTDQPMAGEGIVLIDEIDLHLHPGWQRLMIPQLTRSFPNCQFIITTHSPQVISHVKSKDVFILGKDDGGFTHVKPMESYGKNTDRILEDLLLVDARPAKEKKALRELFAAIQEGRLDEAKKRIEKLYLIIGEDPEITKAQTLIKRKEIIGK
jgi:predicted ATP-binding protein involved in virulence